VGQLIFILVVIGFSLRFHSEFTLDSGTSLPNGFYDGLRSSGNFKNKNVIGVIVGSSSLFRFLISGCLDWLRLLVYFFGAYQLTHS
jgi:hypothetical protein